MGELAARGLAATFDPSSIASSRWEDLAMAQLHAELDHWRIAEDFQTREATAASLRLESQTVPDSAPEAPPQEFTLVPSQPSTFAVPSVPPADPMTTATVERLLRERADLVRQLEESRLEAAQARAIPGTRLALGRVQSREDLVIKMMVAQRTHRDEIAAAQRTTRAEVQVEIDRLQYRLVRSERGIHGMVGHLARSESAATGSYGERVHRTAHERVRDYIEEDSVIRDFMAGRTPGSRSRQVTIQAS